MNGYVCVDLIIGSRDIKAIGVLAQILVSCWFHNNGRWTVLVKNIPIFEIGEGGAIKGLFRKTTAGGFVTLTLRVCSADVAKTG